MRRQLGDSGAGGDVAVDVIGDHQVVVVQNYVVVLVHLLRALKPGYHKNQDSNCYLPCQVGGLSRVAASSKLCIVIMLVKIC